MPSGRAQPASGARGSHLVLYDGVCALCNGLVQFVLTHDRGGAFDFASLQSPEAAAALAPFSANPSDLDTIHVLANYHSAAPRHLTKGRAALFVLRSLGWPWKAAALFAVLPTAILNFGYDLVARHRYRVFGRYEQCLLPRPEFRARFIDVAESRDRSPRADGAAS